MKFIGNIIWVVFGGFILALEYLIFGLLTCCLIITIPFGVQLMKCASLALWPFGRVVVNKPQSTGCLSTGMNLLWIFGGLFLALQHALFGLFFFITILGIPFGKQHFKLAALALAPFGKEIRKTRNPYSVDKDYSQESVASSPSPSSPPIIASGGQALASMSELERGMPNNNSALMAVVAVLSVLVLGVGGYLVYDNVYMPRKIDSEALRCYSMANVVVLRSSRSAGADYNKVASLPYGTELITYERDAEWAHVKVTSPDGEQQEGYVASSYILDKSDFCLLNSIWGNEDSKETIVTTKCRLALLNYFKENRYIGKIDAQVRMEAGIDVAPSDENQWQVFSKPKGAKLNSVLFKRLYKKESQFTDFAVIISNIVNGNRKLLYFYFDDDEAPHLWKEQIAPRKGYIRDANVVSSYSGDDYLNVSYSN